MVFQIPNRQVVAFGVDRGRVSINPTQYFDGVTPDLWSYQVSGCQVLAKWLKDRKGRFLTAADTQHDSRIVVAVAKTIATQEEIDGRCEFLETTK